MAAIVSVVVIGDALEHTTVRAGVVLIAVTGEMHYKEKHLLYKQFLWVKIGIPLEEL